MTRSGIRSRRGKTNYAFHTDQMSGNSDEYSESDQSNYGYDDQNSEGTVSQEDNGDWDQTDPSGKDHRSERAGPQPWLWQEIGPSEASNRAQLLGGHQPGAPSPPRVRPGPGFQSRCPWLLSSRVVKKEHSLVSNGCRETTHFLATT